MVCSSKRDAAGAQPLRDGIRLWRKGLALNRSKYVHPPNLRGAVP